MTAKALYHPTVLKRKGFFDCVDFEFHMTKRFKKVYKKVDVYKVETAAVLSQPGCPDYYYILGALGTGRCGFGGVSPTQDGVT